MGNTRTGSASRWPALQNAPGNSSLVTRIGMACRSSVGRQCTVEGMAGAEVRDRQGAMDGAHEPPGMGLRRVLAQATHRPLALSNGSAAAAAAVTVASIQQQPTSGRHYRSTTSQARYDASRTAHDDSPQTTTAPEGAVIMQIRSSPIRTSRRTPPRSPY